MKKRLKKNEVVLAVCLLFVLAACSKGAGEQKQAAGTTVVSASEMTTSQREVKSAQRDVFAMDTIMTITCSGERCEEALDAVEIEIKRLDELLSVGNPDSEISRINKNGEGLLSADSRVMVEKALDIFEETGGAFDITVYPLMKLWGFTTQEYSVPSAKALSRVLETVGSKKLLLKENEIKLNGAAGIDLGGIAKGYTSDRLMEIFAEYDLISGMVSLGGNVALYRAKPDGSLWRCGIADPHKKGDSSIAGVLEAKNCSVITSGAYERYFVDEAGTRYHHILDPKTGYPANNGLISATIVCENGMLADGLSTACFVMGLDQAIRFWKSSEMSFDMILMTDEDEIYLTEPLAGKFSTDYPVHVIES